MLIGVSLALIFVPSCANINAPIKKLGKSDIDLVTDMHINRLQEHIQELIVQLYERNPEELRKTPQMTIEKRLVQILQHSTDIAYKETNYFNSVAAINLASDKDYEGDRVFSLFLGIGSMIRFSYNNQKEVFILDKLDPQKLYDSARNLEKIIWRLRNEHGKALLELGPAHGKNSFEDIMTRMIAIQDMMAIIIADKSNRIINRVVYGTAGMLIPL